MCQLLHAEDRFQEVIQSPESVQLSDGLDADELHEAIEEVTHCLQQYDHRMYRLALCPIYETSPREQHC